MNTMKRAALTLSTLALVLVGTAVPAQADLIWTAAPATTCTTAYSNAWMRVVPCTDGTVRVYRKVGTAWMVAAVYRTS